MESIIISIELIFGAIVVITAAVFAVINLLKQELKYFKIETESSLKYVEENSKRDLRYLEGSMKSNFKYLEKEMLTFVLSYINLNVRTLKMLNLM